MIYRLGVQTAKDSFFEDYPTRDEAVASLTGLGLATTMTGFAQSKNSGFSVRREHIIGAQISEIEDDNVVGGNLTFNGFEEL